MWMSTAIVSAVLSLLLAVMMMMVVVGRVPHTCMTQRAMALRRVRILRETTPMRRTAWSRRK